jgi:glycolate dehydrogenase FAD-linked subunit
MRTATPVGELSSIVGATHVLTDPDSIRENSTDATKILHPADVVVFPGDTRQVSAIVRLANRERIPVVSRGGGVGYAGGALPVQGGIVIGMRRMNRILEINPVDLLAVVEPGVLTADLDAAAAGRGLLYPPDPASSRQSTLGGNVAHNAGGPRAFKYGVTRQFLLGLEVVLPTGEIIETGGRVVKNSVGYDLTDLMCGSEGTLGVMTKILLRLVPRPEAARTVMALYDSVRSCADSANALVEAGIIPSKLEFVDSQSIEALRRYVEDEGLATAVRLPASARGMLWVEVDGSAAEVEVMARRVVLVLERQAVRVFEDLPGPDLWELRRYLSPAVARIRPDKINEDIVVPRSRLGDYLAAVERVERDVGLPIVCFGHAGDGNIHVNLMLDRSDPDERGRGERAKARIMELAVELGGTISGEHGIGIMKSDFLELALRPGTISAMKAIKAALDPNGIMNPGKIFP